MKKVEPLISVIVPIYKVEKYLRKCVDSILRQTFANLEIILVNDGSPDECAEICNEYQKTDCRIKVIHKSNGGLSSARNAGLDIAKGDYIGFVDSDDWIEPEMYQKLIETAMNSEADVVQCGYKVVTEEGNLVREYISEREDFFGGNEIADAFFKTTKIGDVAWNKLYKASIWDENKYMVGKYHEDAFAICDVILETHSWANIPDVLYSYQLRGTGIVGSGFSLKRLDSVYAAQYKLELSQNHFPSYEKYARIGVCLHCFYLYDLLKGSNFNGEDGIGIQIDHIFSENYTIVAKSDELYSIRAKTRWLVNGYAKNKIITSNLYRLYSKALIIKSKFK